MFSRRLSHAGVDRHRDDGRSSSSRLTRRIQCRAPELSVSRAPGIDHRRNPCPIVLQRIRLRCFRLRPDPRNANEIAFHLRRYRCVTAAWSTRAAMPSLST
jgi:hypothetical protein